MPPTRKMLGIVLSLLMFASFASAAPVAAQNDLSCGDMSPARSSFEVVDNGDSIRSDTATVKFRMSRSQIEAFECADASAEVDFRFTGYKYVEGESRVDFGGNALGAAQDVIVESNGDVVVRAIGIDVSSLDPGRVYTLPMTFSNFYAYGVGVHQVAAEWVPVEWYQESYLGECEDNLAEEVNVGSSYCVMRYDDMIFEFGVHDFGY